MLLTEKTIIEPPFWDDYLHHIPLCNVLVDHFQPIKKEVLPFVAEKDPLIDFPKYGYYDEKNKVERKQLYENTWKAMPITKFVREFDELDTSIKTRVDTLAKYVQENLPYTYSLIREYEEKDWLANAFISRLAPKSVIHPHTGRSDLFLRIHLCLVEDPDCSITVGSETQSWKEGKLLAFKDGGPYQHSVVHTGKGERLILSVDLLISAMKQFIPNL